MCFYDCALFFTTHFRKCDFSIQFSQAQTNFESLRHTNNSFYINNKHFEQAWLKPINSLRLMIDLIVNKQQSKTDFSLLLRYWVIKSDEKRLWSNEMSACMRFAYNLQAAKQKQNTVRKQWRQPPWYSIRPWVALYARLRPSLFSILFGLSRFV